MTTRELNVVVENRVLILPSLHDAEIVSLFPSFLESEWQLKIDVVLDATSRFIFEFSNVRNLICNNMNFQNVIYDVFILSQEELLDDIEKYKPLLGITSQYDFEHFTSQLAKNNLFLVQFNPSVGAEIIVICSKMRVYS